MKKKRTKWLWLPMTLVALVVFSAPPFSGNVYGGAHSKIIKKLNKIIVILETAPAPPAPVEKTGQDTSYEAGDDGVKAGVAWPKPRFTDNGDGTITDNLTGLIWDKDANRFSYDTWSNSLSACNNLADNGGDLTDGSQAGDWRLPNRNELISLILVGFFNPALPDTIGTGQWSEGDPFSDVQSSYYWSSTTDTNSTGFAWGVGFLNGNVGGNGKTGYDYAWCVRGGL